MKGTLMERLQSLRTRAWVGALVVLGMCAPALHAAPLKDMTVVELTADSPGGGIARDVNNGGDVVGHTFTPGSGGLFSVVSHAFLWRNGVRQDIGSAVGKNSVAWAINEPGTIVGQVDGLAYMWKDGQATSLNVAGSAVALNNHGDIVGTLWTGGAIGSGQDHPFLVRDGLLYELPTLNNGGGAGVNDINDAGIAVGFSLLPFSSNEHAVLWQDRVISDLGTLGGLESFGNRINNRGDIVGTAQDASGARFMARWSASGGPPQKLLPNFTPMGINERGDVVGNDTSTGAPLLYQDGQVTNLLELPAMKAGGWQSFAPMGINDRGWIVGSAWKPGVSFFGTALLLMPH
jgi:probable HAF family extracellular repeat protein